MSERPLAFSVGHSTRSLEELLTVLGEAGVRRVADVRTVPRSRRVPQFNAEGLARALPERGLAYVHLPALGGWRRPRADSPNAGWSNAAFRGYADHMDSAEFAAGLAELEALARALPTAAMCAEAPWWRCHRRLLADALLARGWRVEHLGLGRRTMHELTSFAVVRDGRVSYPAEQTALEL